MSNNLKVTFIDNSATQYDGFADEIKYNTKKTKGKLYLGDRHSCAMVQLKHRNCNAVVNCDTDLFGLSREKDIRYLKVDPCIDDDELKKCTDHALKIFEIAFNFIDQELNLGHNILVHCEKGVTKSAAIVVYYIMKKQDISLAQAYREVKKYRDCILPQPSLFKHLISAEISLRGIDSVRIQGKQVIYLEKSQKGNTTSANSIDSSEIAQRYFIGGVLVSVVVAVFVGVYLLAGKL
jgi:protein-tyrosine phosphatase